MNPLLISFRVLKRYKLFTLINILSLTAGLVATFFILTWVLNEFSYNKFLHNAENIHKVLLNIPGDKGSIQTIQTTPYPLAKGIEEVPEVKQVVQITEEKGLRTLLDEKTNKVDMLSATPNFFEAFSFSMISGNPSGAMENIHSIVISKSLSERLFNGLAMGETIQIFTVDRYIGYEVTGVFQDVPNNSTLQFEAVIPLKALSGRHSNLENWYNNWVQTFVVAEGQIALEELSSKIQRFMVDRQPDFQHVPLLQNIKDLHLYSAFKEGVNSGGRIQYVWLSIFIMVIILVISAVNYSNLVLTLSYKRGKEISMKRILGINRRDVFINSLSDALIVVVLSLAVSIIIIFLLLPYYEELVGVEIRLIDLFDIMLVPLIVMVLVGIGLAILLSIYPAIYYWSVKPVNLLKSPINYNRSKLRLNEVFLIVQFIISTGLLVFTVIVSEQTKSIRNKNLGFDYENVLVFEMDEGLYSNYGPLKSDLNSLAFIEEVGYSSFNFGFDPGTTGDVSWPGMGKDDGGFPISPILVGSDFTQTLDMKIVKGRHFNKRESDLYSFIVNESAASEFPWPDPVGKQLNMWGKSGRIVGVVEDFNIKPLYQPTEPVILQLDTEECEYLYLKSRSPLTPDQLNMVKSKLLGFSPYYYFEYSSLDNIVNSAYRSDVILKDVFNWATFFILVISILGLYSFSAFAVQQYKRDITIKKVLGSSLSNVILFYSKRFLRLVVIAILTSLPIVVLLSSNWLDNFSYRISLGPGLLILPCLLIAFLSGFCVFFQVYIIGRSNPAQTLYQGS